MLSAQSLVLSPVTGAPGEYVNVAIAWQPPAARAAVALQWQLEIPSGPLVPLKGRIGREMLSVKDAGKSLTCAVAGSTAAQQLVSCVLAGGQKAIPTGTIAVLPLRISESAQPADLPIRLAHGLGVSADLKPIPIDPAETKITVRPR